MHLKSWFSWTSTSSTPPSSATAKHGALLHNLPNELLLHIAGYLSLRTLIHLRNVDTRWRSVISAAADSGLPDPTRNLLKAWIVATSSLSAKISDASYPYTTPLVATNAGPTVLPAPCPSSSHSEPAVPWRLTDTDRAGYVAAVGRYALSFKAVSHEEPGLSNEFLEWLYEWPAQAALRLSVQTDESRNGFWGLSLSPSVPSLRTKATCLTPHAVVSTLTNSASYHGTRGRSGIPWYYYQERVIFMLVLEDNDVLLPRVQILQDEASPAADSDAASREPRLRCSLLPQSPVHPGFGGDWARFLPISTLQKSRSSNATPDTSLSTTDSADSIFGSEGNSFDAELATEPPPVPLYILSGSGLGERMAGSVCTVGPDAVLRIEARSWAEWITRLAAEPQTPPPRVPRGQDEPIATPSSGRESEETTLLPPSDKLEATSLLRHLFLIAFWNIVVLLSVLAVALSPTVWTTSTALLAVFLLTRVF